MNAHNYIALVQTPAGIVTCFLAATTLAILLAEQKLSDNVAVRVLEYRRMHWAG